MISSASHSIFEQRTQGIWGRFRCNSSDLEAQTQHLLSCGCAWGENGWWCPYHMASSPIATTLKGLSLANPWSRGRAARAPEGLKRTTQSGGWITERSSFRCLLSVVSYTTSCSTRRPPLIKVSHIVSLARLPLKKTTLSPFSHIESIFSARAAALPDSSPIEDTPSKSCRD